MDYCSIVDELKERKELSEEAYRILLCQGEEQEVAYLRDIADKVRREIYGNSIFIRGLIEISDYCKNDCLYCGIRRSNRSAVRYRLEPERIIDCVDYGYDLGFRTFVLQGGEDAYFNDGIMCDIISTIKQKYIDCAVTLSLGERSTESYEAMFDAGADRYLLRHETADKCHYEYLHPDFMSYDNRMKCLHELKRIGYQTGCGMMVGSPHQTIDNIISDLKFIKQFKPEMVGIGPFIPHEDTPFSHEKVGSVELTLRLLSIIRLMHPNVLLPATTALATVADKGREDGIRAGANVVMPNLSPREARENYRLYNNIAHAGEEAAEGLQKLIYNMKRIGYAVVVGRGDPIQ